MSPLTSHPTLKEISAYKKKLNWGELPAIFHMALSSIGDIDGILTHGFDSPYKKLLNKNTWNLALLESYHDEKGNIQVKNKPKIALRHIYSAQHYELHCYPVINDTKIITTLRKHPECPFQVWLPETMQRLFRISSLVSFLRYSLQNGDEADFALIKFAYYKVEALINILKEQFTVTEIKGYNIAAFYREMNQRQDKSYSDLFDSNDDHPVKLNTQ
jgi:hypothetical protein